MYNDFNTAEEMIDDMIFRGQMSPAAADMDPAEAIAAYNEANALTPEDDDFLVDPELQRTTITTTGGTEIRGWSLRSNPAAKVATPNVALAKGADRLSRQLGAILTVGH
jgi:hypothetical protein